MTRPGGKFRTPLILSGAVARVLVNPPGDLDGLVLTSGEQVRFPPDNVGWVAASGCGIRSAFGAVVEAESLVIGNQTITLR